MPRQDHIHRHSRQTFQSPDVGCRVEVDAAAPSMTAILGDNVSRDENLSILPGKPINKRTARMAGRVHHLDVETAHREAIAIAKNDIHFTRCVRSMVKIRAGSFVPSLHSLGALLVSRDLHPSLLQKMRSGGMVVMRMRKQTMCDPRGIEPPQAQVSEDLIQRRTVLIRHASCCDPTTRSSDPLRVLF